MSQAVCPSASASARSTSSGFCQASRDGSSILATYSSRCSGLPWWCWPWAPCESVIRTPSAIARMRRFSPFRRVSASRASARATPPGRDRAGEEVGDQLAVERRDQLGGARRGGAGEADQLALRPLADQVAGEQLHLAADQRVDRVAVDEEVLVAEAGGGVEAGAAQAADRAQHRRVVR